MRIALGQINCVVGDLADNVEKMADWAREATSLGADLACFPELAVTGYPPEDLVLRAAFVDDNLKALEELAAQTKRTCAVLTGFVDRSHRGLHNAAALLLEGRVEARYHKHRLPNYGVFDEQRYFVPGEEGCALRLAGSELGISVCEDAWRPGPPLDAYAGRVQIIPNINGSPYHRRKTSERLEVCAARARETGAWIIYVNCVGGQDELVFDGGSLVVDAAGEVLHRAEQFRTERFCLDVPVGPARSVDGRARTVHARVAAGRPPAPPPRPAPRVDEAAQVWSALVMGTRGFARRNGADAAVLGLSGGIDSSVTAAVAAEALGPENVLALSMPAPGTPEEDLAGARRLAENLGIGFETIAMDAVVRALGNLLAPIIEGRPTGGTHHDLLARMRGAVLLAVSDELGHLPLATGNKTELSIGSAALYGDMAGAFAPLKDCPKTLLYRLARHRNALGPAIPESTLVRTPSALWSEEVTLPPYEQLDEIVERYVERAEGLNDIVADGFDPVVVRGVLQLIDDAEPKRRQMPPGVKITARAFGKDRRMPITNAWRPFADESTELAGAAEWVR